MDRFSAPAEPPEFRRSVAKIRASVRAAVRNKKRLSFPNKWSDFKAYFSRAQFRKCAYCEVLVIGTQRGDVDHFFPKKAVWALPDDEQFWGVETADLSSVSGREIIVLCKRGYWWLAYEWSNYLLTCLVCNQNWKLAYFPVHSLNRTIPPTRHAQRSERPLLLHPFRGPDPARHLAFDGTGCVIAYQGSTYGYESIRTFGLDRPSLRIIRREKATKAEWLLNQIANARVGSKVYKQHLRDLWTLGHKEHGHSGMVRSMFEQITGLRWSDLRRLVR